MYSIQRLERLIYASKSLSKLQLRAYKRLNDESSLYIKKVYFDNLKHMKEIEEALKVYKLGDRKLLDNFIYYRLKWLSMDEVNIEIENLLKQI